MSALERAAGVDEAVILAATAHRGQLDKAGDPYILHVLRVALAQVTPATRIVALLHDVVEDSPCDLGSLRAAGFGEAIVQAVDALTRRPAELYPAYILRVAENDLAVPVKLADLEDNLREDRILSPRRRDRERWAKYRAAHKQLSRCL